MPAAGGLGRRERPLEMPGGLGEQPHLLVDPAKVALDLGLHDVVSGRSGEARRFPMVTWASRGLPLNWIAWPSRCNVWASRGSDPRLGQIDGRRQVGHRLVVAAAVELETAETGQRGRLAGIRRRAPKAPVAIFVENLGIFSHGRRVLAAALRPARAGELVGYGFELVGIGAAIDCRPWAPTRRAC